VSGRLHHTGISGFPVLRGLGASLKMAVNREGLEQVYRIYNSRKWVHPDPLEVLYDYRDPLDREVVGIIAASLAYGRVLQILKSVRFVLEKMGTSPREFLASQEERDLLEAFRGFKHRFTTAQDLVTLLVGIRHAVKRFGSLEACFRCGYRDGHDTVLPALSRFVSELSYVSKTGCNSLVPRPEKGSACKRLHLYLRWMVRRDRVDLGVWDAIPPRKLVVPLDTHMHRMGVHLNFTRRSAADLRTVVEITKGFQTICPEDPVRYDFALTRIGMRGETIGDALSAEAFQTEG
jgi:uncharacterized protein (TIGR02757 family)